MTGRESALNDTLSVIKGEYKEMPGLRLTRPQVRRLWGLDPVACDAVLETLQTCHFLRVTPDGHYMLAEDANRPRSARETRRGPDGERGVIEWMEPFWP